MLRKFGNLHSAGRTPDKPSKGQRQRSTGVTNRIAEVLKLVDAEDPEEDFDSKKISVEMKKLDAEARKIELDLKKVEASVEASIFESQAKTAKAKADLVKAKLDELKASHELDKIAQSQNHK